MSSWAANLTLNHKLGLVALALGGVAVLSRVAPERTLTLNAKELLTRIERQDDHVTPAELATWIIEGRTDYRLIDIRDAAAFAAYHIPTAEHVPLSEVADGGLARTDKLVLYGDGGIHAAQAQIVLGGMGYRRVYTLREGLDAWKDEVLYPSGPEHPDAEHAARFERAVRVARFFGGQPRAATPAGTSAPAAPVAAPEPVPPPPVSTPALPAGGVFGAPPAKKKEGC